MIETISENFPRPEIYLKLQPDPSLEVSLLNVFTDVVEFSVQALQYFGYRSTGEFKLLPSRGLITVPDLPGLKRLCGLTRLPCKEQFGGILDRLRKHSRDANDNAKAIEMSGGGGYRAGKIHGTDVYSEFC